MIYTLAMLPLVALMSGCDFLPESTLTKKQPPVLEDLDRIQKTHAHQLALFTFTAEQWDYKSDWVRAHHENLNLREAHDQYGSFFLPKQFEWPWSAEWMEVHEKSRSHPRLGYMKGFSDSGFFEIEEESLLNPTAEKISLFSEDLPFYFCSSKEMKTIDGVPFAFGMNYPMELNTWLVVYGDDRVIEHNAFLPQKATMPPDWQKKYAQYKVPPMPKEMLANILAFSAGQPLPFPNQGKAVNE